MSLFPEVAPGTPPANRPAPPAARKVLLTTERPDVATAIADGKARRAAAKAEAARRRTALATEPAEEPEAPARHTGRAMTPANAAAWEELQRLGHCTVKSQVAVEAMRRAAAKIGRKIDSRWHADQGVANIVLRSEVAAVPAARTSASAAPAKSPTPKAAPVAAPKAKRTSVAPAAPKSPTAPLPEPEAKSWRDVASPPLVVSVNPTPSMVLVRDGSRIEVFAPSVVTIDTAGAVRVEPAGGVR